MENRWSASNAMGSECIAALPVSACGAKVVKALDGFRLGSLALSGNRQMPIEEGRWMMSNVRMGKLIERARVYVIADAAGEVNLGEVIEAQRAAIEAASRFFREVMPKMNVADSALDADSIVVWTQAENAVFEAVALLERSD